MATTDEKIEAVKKIILGNRRIAIGEVVHDAGISFGSCQAASAGVLQGRVFRNFKVWEFETKNETVIMS